MERAKLEKCTHFDPSRKDKRECICTASGSPKELKKKNKKNRDIWFVVVSISNRCQT